MSLSVQLSTLYSMIGVGLFIGMAVDTYRRLFNRNRHKGWTVFIYDFLFWIVQALVTFYILFIVNNGELRFYIFLALLCGFAAYQSLVKNVYLPALERIIEFVHSVFHALVTFFYRGFYRPIIAIIGFFLTICFSILRGIWMIGLQIGKLVWNIFYKPFLLLGKFIWNLLPNSFKIYVNKFFHRIRTFLNDFWRKLVSKNRK
ncbi:spore cortex biosynthesis protein YabQ [Fervidibacillus albus]|uniref:Spore cortex biosynthesis protein YabQ n=1 Tax=Fervidibacillus albus TaxID=2980026 RepID=A0A9E8LTR0_9BACI|nr:spore cortex biosynthesis protein YabQ [Fervidibacillus albus]WAA09477.1 spore cortex biosynthesis protein YabQ [Fervidibacillus albus]